MQVDPVQLTVTNRKKRILLIEDNSINIHIVKDMLFRAGYEVNCATDGLEGLTMVKEFDPDLILLDVVMPEISGFEVCRRLKADPETAVIPIIFMTSESETDSIVQGFELGAVDYITKPFQFREMIARVQTHLTLRELRTSLENEIIERESLIADLSAFTHMVAHDLKNPVSNIMGFSDLLISHREGLSEQDVVASLGNIKNSGAKIHQIIDSLLLLANVRLKQVEYEPTDIKLLIYEVKSRLHTQIVDSGFELNFPEQWPKVVGYPPWIEEVLANFVSNAIKYGGIPPKAEISFSYEENDFLKVMIKDNGEGLSLEDQAKLFQPFSRFHTGIQGHGLGLSITKRIIEKLDGVVGVETELGKGATFFFTVPLAE